MTATCSIDACENPVYARGWCLPHYGRWRRKGDPNYKHKPPRRGEAVRFWAFVDKTPTCWLWTGSTTGSGYGKFWRDDGSTCSAHRLAYELLVGPIPDGAELDHVRERCTSRHCVKVIEDDYGMAHLEPVTPRENTLRSDAPTARNARKTHCPQGHPYDLENTYVMPRSKSLPNGGRACRKCRHTAYLKYTAKQKGIPWPEDWDVSQLAED